MHTYISLCRKLFLPFLAVCFLFQAMWQTSEMLIQLKCSRCLLSICFGVHFRVKVMIFQLVKINFNFNRPRTTAWSKIKWLWVGQNIFMPANINFIFLLSLTHLKKKLYQYSGEKCQKLHKNSPKVSNSTFPVGFM